MLLIIVILPVCMVFPAVWRTKTGEQGQTSQLDERLLLAEHVTAAVCVRNRDRGLLTASGSGVIFEISEKALWIVTSGHVLETAGGENEVCVDFAGLRKESTEDRFTVQCQTYELARDADLAFLYIPREEFPEEIWEELRAAETDKESYDALKASTPLYIAGYRGDELIVCEGALEEFWIYVEDFEQYMILAECEIYPGMSGGGLYDGAGHLIGIGCGGNEEGELAAVPLHVVQAGFADIGTCYFEANDDRIGAGG